MFISWHVFVHEKNVWLNFEWGVSSPRFKNQGELRLGSPTDNSVERQRNGLVNESRSQHYRCRINDVSVKKVVVFGASSHLLSMCTVFESQAVQQNIGIFIRKIYHLKEMMESRLEGFSGFPFAYDRLHKGNLCDTHLPPVTSADVAKLLGTIALKSSSMDYVQLQQL